MEMYSRCLTIAPYHEEARSSIEFVKGRQGLASTETIPLLTPGKAHGMKETLKHLLAQHSDTKTKKSKKKKDKKYSPLYILFYL
jgi:hypothetical protein